jgi:formate hydrogenlyase subunit 3/multisubunit Na+/H+ antiporter MnhD subunit
MDISSFTVSFALIFDSLTAIMLIVVTSISSLVHIYSTQYMAGDPHLTSNTRLGVGLQPCIEWSKYVLMMILM